MIEPVAEKLNVPKTNILANSILFNDDATGSYSGFDPAEPTSRDGGKPAALRKVAEEKGHKSIVMFGDGATDAQAKPPAAAFIGFGGVQERESVRAKADWYVWDWEDVTGIVKGRETTSTPSLDLFDTDDGVKLFVGNISFDTSTERFREVFSEVRKRLWA